MKTKHLSLALKTCIATALVSFAGTSARAQYTITGTTTGGGNIVTGSGNTLGSVASGDGTLSVGGFDNLTFLPGSYATSLTADTVLFTTPNNIVLNSGTVSAGVGFNAITFIGIPAQDIAGIVTNTGLIAPIASGSLASVNIGGNLFTGTLTGGNVGAGIDFVTQYSLLGPQVNNQGSITGAGVASASDSTYGGNLYTSHSAGGNAGDGIDFTYYGSGTGILVANSGSIAGGSFGTVTDSSIGENNHDQLDVGGNAGNGITMDGGELLKTSIANQGSISGGSFNTITNSRVGSNNGLDDAGGDVANAIAISTVGFDLHTFSLTNQGSISGGSITNNAGVAAGNYAQSDVGGNATSGVAISGYNMHEFSFINQGAITGGAIAGNSGNIGGNYGSIDTGGNVSMGVAITGSTTTGVTISNYGTIAGGAITNNSSSIGGNHGGGIGGSVGDGLSIATSGPMTNVSILNTGTIAGGNISNDTGSIGGQHGAAGGDVGSGLSLLSAVNGSNLSITNYGVIAGGNNSSNSAGVGILANTGNLTINNWGTISAGSGANPFAINLGGSNNTVNLNGHSSVNGPISAPGGSNNALNLNFTGLSPATQAALKAGIIAQGPLSNWSGTFTVRGVTYTVDPMIINFNLSSYQQQAKTPNQSAIGASLDSAGTNPPAGSPLATLFNALDNSGNVPATLEQLSPQEYELFGDIAIVQASAMVTNIDRRLNNIRDGSESVDTSGIGGSSTGLTSGLSKNDDGKSSKEIAPAPKPEDHRWGFFATGDGLFFRADSHNVDMQDGKSNSAGTLVGVDAKVGDNAIVGALFSYQNTSATLDSNGGHSDIDSYSGGLYGSWHEGGFYVNALGAYTRNHYNNDRSIFIPGLLGSAQGSTNGDQATANLDGGYDFNLTDRLSAGPLLGVQYVHLNVDGFNETSAPGALAVGSQDMSSLQSRLGARAEYHIATTDHSSFAAEAYAAWQHEYLDDSRSIGASFQGLGLAPFAVQTASPLRDAGVAGIGLNWTFHNRLTLFADYELTIWQSSYFNQTINGGGRVSF